MGVEGVLLQGNYQLIDLTQSVAFLPNYSIYALVEKGRSLISGLFFVITASVAYQEFPGPLLRHQSRLPVPEGTDEMLAG